LSAVVVTMESHNRKHDPILRKIKRLFVHNGGKPPHKLYPKEYFWQCWFNEADANGIEIVAIVKKVPKREAAHIMAEIAFHHIMGELVAKDMDEMDDTQLAERARLYLKIRKLARANGWDVSKIFPRPSKK
jgi:hypothetical protein